MEIDERIVNGDRFRQAGNDEITRKKRAFIN